MISLVVIAAALMFLLMVVLDIWKKAVPSILGTGILFVLAVVGMIVIYLPYACKSNQALFYRL